MHRAGPGERRRSSPRPGDAEVGDLHLALRRDEHVAGLDVAVHDAVRVGERRAPSAMSARDLGAAATARAARRLDHVAERLAVDVLHDDEGGVVLLAPVVDRDDVRVVQAGGGLRLAPEALDERWRRDESSGESTLSATGRSSFGRGRGTRRPCRRGRSPRRSRSGPRRRGSQRAAWSREATSGGVAGRTGLWQQLLRGDRRGDLAAGRLAADVAAVLDDHRDRVLRRLGRRERDEPRVRAAPSRRSPRCRSCPRP